MSRSFLGVFGLIYLTIVMGVCFGIFVAFIQYWLFI